MSEQNGKSKSAVAKALAATNTALDPGISTILQFFGDNREHEERDSAVPIKLLEVNVNTSPDGIVPLYFGPNPQSGVYFHSVIIEVTPEEYDEIKAGKLKLPEGWEQRVVLETKQEVP